MNWLERLSVLHNTEDGGADGGGGGEGPELQLKRLLDKHGNDALSLARDLYSDNYKARDRARKAEARVKELEAKVPGEGAVVLTGDDAKSFNQFKELGKSVDDVKAAFSIEGEFHKLKRQQTFDKAAEVMEWNKAALADLLGEREVTITGEGKEAKVEVTVGDNQKKALKEWVEAEKAHFLPALTTTEGNNDVHFGAGGNREGKPGGDPVGDWLTERNKAETSAKNPLDG